MTAHRTGSTHPDEVRIGTVVQGRYRIVERLGEGGFATVFKAHDPIDDRWLALKVLHASTRLRFDASFKARFEREARLAARIRHPSVVSILGHGTAGALEQPFIAMEFLEGYDLDFMLEQEGRFDVGRALRLLMPCLEALGHGHAQGIVHKDLKPGNLFITHPGTPHEHMKVLDFGIARRDAADERKITQAGEVTGTPEYLAPEYINSALVTPALDVYQMGLILVEMLTGEPLVQAESPIGCVIAHSQGVKVPLELLETPLAAVLQRATALDPNQRYPDAEAFRRALAQVRSDDVEVALSQAEITIRGRRVARPDTVQAARAEADSRPSVDRPDTVADPSFMNSMGAFDPSSLRQMLETGEGHVDDLEDQEATRAHTAWDDDDDDQEAWAFGPTLGPGGTGLPPIDEIEQAAQAQAARGPASARSTMAAAPGIMPPAPWLVGDDEEDAPATMQVPQLPDDMPWPDHPMQPPRPAATPTPARPPSPFHENATRPLMQPFNPPQPSPGVDPKLLVLAIGGGMLLLIVVALVIRLLM